MRFATALEPEGLVEQFLAHPPRGFVAQRSRSGMPSFVAPLDLLTTLDPELRRRIVGLPLYRRWGRLLHWRTRFAGCTVTEYAPLPSGSSPDALVQELLELDAGACAVLVVKDLPDNSPLLEVAANERADAFVAALVARGFVLLEGMPLAWVPIDFDSPDEYLARLSSARRKDVRRKLRARERLQVEALPTGSPCFEEAAVLDVFYDLYRQVHAQSEIQFDLLEPAFFTAVLRDAGSGGVVFTYRSEERLIGWNLCYEHAGKLIDKYVGFAYPQAREHNLYAVSWMHNLGYACERGLSHYVAGWTDTAIKRHLGARFSLTRHAVYLRQPLLRALLRRLAHRFAGEPATSLPVGTHP